ncbi:hypothetical protein V1502_10690 [Bacillus sp. SCS-153A]
MGELHHQLLKWTADKGCQRRLDAYIVEVYHPLENGEEVQIYLPIHS